MPLSCPGEQFQLEEKGCTDQGTADYKGKLEATGMVEWGLKSGK